jgi:putative two-component system response regulator
LAVPALTEGRILIVDDESANVLLLERILQRAGYHNLRSTNDPRRVLPLFAEFRPDLVLLDLHMPHFDGFAVMEQLRPRVPEGQYLPILVLTADITSTAKQRALSNGAKDFLTKPLDATEIVLRIENLLHTRQLHTQLQDQNIILEEKVRDRTRDLENAQLEMMERLARAAEYRDYDTGTHAQRVGDMSSLLGEALGLPYEESEMIRRAAPLHDVGKIGIPDVILLKPGKLTVEEFEQMKAHTVIGAGILSGSRSRLLQLAEEIALYHHEWWNGAGYAGLEGTEIPIAARICAVADVYDALTHARPYRGAWPLEDVTNEIHRKNGTHFDPGVVDAFVRIKDSLPWEPDSPEHVSGISTVG